MGDTFLGQMPVQFPHSRHEFAFSKPSRQDFISLLKIFLCSDGQIKGLDKNLCRFEYAPANNFFLQRPVEAATVALNNLLGHLRVNKLSVQKQIVHIVDNTVRLKCGIRRMLRRQIRTFSGRNSSNRTTFAYLYFYGHPWCVGLSRKA